VPEKECIILVPSGNTGHYDYSSLAESALSAAAGALLAHDAKIAVSQEKAPQDDGVIIVIPDGVRSTHWNFHGQLKERPAYNYTVRRVRQWIADGGAVSPAWKCQG
jgi:hypothetical protein